MPKIIKAPALAFMLRLWQWQADSRINKDQIACTGLVNYGKQGMSTACTHCVTGIQEWSGSRDKRTAEKGELQRLSFKQGAWEKCCWASYHFWAYRSLQVLLESNVVENYRYSSKASSGDGSDNQPSATASGDAPASSQSEASSGDGKDGSQAASPSASSAAQASSSPSPSGSGDDPLKVCSRTFLMQHG